MATSESMNAVMTCIGRRSRKPGWCQKTLSMTTSREAYNTKTGGYSLFLDRCILKNKSVVNKIMSELNLPTKRTKMDADIHYRCRHCLGRGR